MSSETRWPGECDEAHPDVFTKAPPPLGGERKPGQLTPEQVNQYFDKGYVLVENVLPLEDLDLCRKAIEEEVEKLAQKLYAAKKIQNLHSDLGLFERLTAIEKDFPGANIIMHKMGAMPQAFANVWTNERLLNIAEQLLGTQDIVGSPIWNIRTKTPQNEATTVPWHQDAAYMDPEAYFQMMVTAWIPLLDADETNGCMQMVPEGHRAGKVAKHNCCHGGTWYVMLEEDEMKKTLGVDAKDAVTCPVPYGSALLFNNIIPHRSLPNMSRNIRWSLDLRWQSADKPVGFFGLKDGVRMRSSQPGFKGVDWDAFNTVDRHYEQFSSVDAEQADLDTTIQGPWMRQWEIVHMNRHTEEFEKVKHLPPTMPLVVG